MTVLSDFRAGLERRTQRDEEWPVAVRTAAAFASLAQRMNDGDHPDEDTEEAEHIWTFTLTGDERAAYNALRGANYGPTQSHWFTSEHPIVRFFKAYLKWKL